MSGIEDVQPEDKLAGVRSIYKDELTKSLALSRLTLARFDDEPETTGVRLTLPEDKAEQALMFATLITDYDGKQVRSPVNTTNMHSANIVALEAWQLNTGVVLGNYTTISPKTAEPHKHILAFRDIEAFENYEKANSR